MNIIEVARRNVKNVTPAIRETMRFYALPFQPGSFEIKLASKKKNESQMELSWVPLRTK